MRIIDGVTLAVNEKMNAVRGDVLREDGLIERVCEHDVRHPVGDIHSGVVSFVNKEAHIPRCCEGRCCEQWALTAREPLNADFSQEDPMSNDKEITEIPDPPTPTPQGDGDAGEPEIAPTEGT
jgi:hypothetical protein